MKRRAAHFAMIVLLGLITTIAVAVWCVYRSPTTVRYSDVLSPDLEFITIRPQWRSYSPFTLQRARGYEEFTAMQLIGISGTWPPAPPEETTWPPEWATRIAKPQSPDSHGTFRFDGLSSSIARAGWPFYCFGGVIHRDGYQSLDRSTNAIRINTRFQGMWGTYPVSRVLPLRPQPLELTLNSLLFAFVWFLVFRTFAFVPIAWRMNRKRRGLCPKCAYDLQSNSDSGCPECGWNRDLARGNANE